MRLAVYFFLQIRATVLIFKYLWYHEAIMMVVCQAVTFFTSAMLIGSLQMCHIIRCIVPR